MTRTLKILSPLALSLALGFTAPGLVSAQEAPTTEEGAREGCRDHGARGRHGRGMRGHRGEHGRRGHEGMLRELNLTDAQRAQVRSIRESRRTQVRALRAERSPENREALRALRTEMREEVSQVLTPAQRTQLESLRTARHAERTTHRIERMTEHLSLTPAQVSRVTAIFEDAATARQLARRNGDTETAMRAVRERTRAAIDRVLTDEQKALRSSHRRGGENGRRGHRGRGHGNAR